MRSGIGGDYAVAVTFNTMKQDGGKNCLWPKRLENVVISNPDRHI